MSADVNFLHAVRDSYTLAIMLEINHPDGMQYLWSGVGDLDYNGHTYYGKGILGSITTSRRTLEVRVDDVVLTLGGIDPQILDQVSYEIRDREANTYMVALDDWAQVRGRSLIDNMIMDYMNDTYGDDGTVRVEIHAQAGFWSLVYPSKQVWSPEDQKQTYPDDTGMDYVPSLENKETKWTKD